MDGTDVDVTNLSFGPAVVKNPAEWQKTPVLSNAEVTLLLNKRKKDHEDKGMPVPEVLSMTLEYCRRYSNVRNLEDEGSAQYLQSVRSTLEQFGEQTDGPKDYKRELHPYEVAALANLMTTTSDKDEACALIPSLRRSEDLGDRFSDEEVEQMLEALKDQLQPFQETEDLGDDEDMDV